jgi:hypothetical protein
MQLVNLVSRVHVKRLIDDRARLASMASGARKVRDYSLNLRISLREEWQMMFSRRDMLAATAVGGAMTAATMNTAPRRPCRQKWPCTGVALVIVGGLMTTVQAAESGEGMGLRNLTSATITQLYASPVGQNTFGPDQIALVPGHAVDHDKILKPTDIAPGRYELRISDNTGRVCWVRNITLEANEVVPLQDKDLTDCKP